MLFAGGAWENLWVRNICVSSGQFTNVRIYIHELRWWWKGEDACSELEGGSIRLKWPYSKIWPVVAVGWKGKKRKARKVCMHGGCGCSEKRPRVGGLFSVVAHLDLSYKNAYAPSSCVTCEHLRTCRVTVAYLLAAELFLIQRQLFFFSLYLHLSPPGFPTLTFWCDD